MPSSGFSKTSVKSEAVESIENASEVCTKLWEVKDGQMIVANIKVRTNKAPAGMKSAKEYKILPTAQIITRSRSLSASLSDFTEYGEANITFFDINQWLFPQNIKYVTEGNEFSFEYPSYMIPENTEFKYQTTDGVACSCRSFGPSEENKGKAESEDLHQLTVNKEQIRSPGYNRLFCMPNDVLVQEGKTLIEYFNFLEEYAESAAIQR